MDLRKTNYLLIVMNVILILSLFSLSFYFIFRAGSSSFELGKNQDVQGSSIIESADSDFDPLEYQIEHDAFSDLVSSGDLESCESLSLSFRDKCRDSILMSQALKGLDVSKCELIQNSDLVEICKMSVQN